VRNCFATGAGNGQALVGNPFGGTRPNSFWDPDPGQFMTPSHSVYTQAPAWDFVNTWKINPGVSLPELR
jgi:hypothetical protein